MFVQRGHIGTGISHLLIIDEIGISIGGMVQTEHFHRYNFLRGVRHSQMPPPLVQGAFENAPLC